MRENYKKVSWLWGRAWGPNGAGALQRGVLNYVGSSYISHVCHISRQVDIVGDVCLNYSGVRELALTSIESATADTYQYARR